MTFWSHNSHLWIWHWTSCVYTLFCLVERYHTNKTSCFMMPVIKVTLTFERHSCMSYNFIVIQYNFDSALQVEILHLLVEVLPLVSAYCTCKQFTSRKIQNQTPLISMWGGEDELKVGLHTVKLLYLLVEKNSTESGLIKAAWNYFREPSCCCCIVHEDERNCTYCLK